MTRAQELTTILRRSGRLTAADLLRLTGMPAGTLYVTLQRMESKGRVNSAPAAGVGSRTREYWIED